MRIGVPREIKPLEGRVALIPAACSDLVRAGHTVYVQAGAGEKSAFSDAEFAAVGAELVPDAATLYSKAELVVKVKEPVDGDLRHLHADHRLFCFLHLAAEPALTRRLLDIGLTAVGFETVEENDGSLPLLAPMSLIAGSLAVQIGAHLLHQPQGGKGVLLGGLPAAPRGHVVVLGSGVAGGNSARLAASMGARVTAFDKRMDRMNAMMNAAPNVTALYPYSDVVAEMLSTADLVIGAVLVTGSRTPRLVTRDMVASMEPGSVIVDVSVDQGGCVETTHPTTYADPTYQQLGVTHFAVTNMPGGVPRTASHALSAAILPYVQQIAEPEWQDHPPLARGVNVSDGELVHPALR